MGFARWLDELTPMGEMQPLVRCSLRWAGDTAVRWDTVGESRLRVGRYTAPRPEFRLTASDHSGMVIQAAAAPYSQPVPFWFGCKDNGVSAEITLNGPTDRARLAAPGAVYFTCPDLMRHFAGRPN